MFELPVCSIVSTLVKLQVTKSWAGPGNETIIRPILFLFVVVCWFFVLFIDFCLLLLAARVHNSYKLLLAEDGILWEQVCILLRLINANY